MPVPGSIDDLSTTPSGNSPAGTETPTDGDNHIRTAYSFIAQLRDKLNGTTTPTLNDPAFSGTATGSLAGLSLVSPAFSGTASGSLAGVTLASPTFSGTASGSLAGVTLVSPSISGDITALGVAISRSKSATTSRASTTSLADDPHLIVPLTSGKWAVSLWVPYWATTGGAGGFKCQIAYSGTSTSSSYAVYATINSAFVAGTTVANSSPLLNGGGTIIVSSGVTGADWVAVEGTITVTVAGNLSFQWAQGSSNSNAANAGIGGWMSCTKVA